MGCAGAIELCAVTRVASELGACTTPRGGAPPLTRVGIACR